MSGRPYWYRNRSARRAGKERTVVPAWLDAFSVLDVPRLVVLLTDGPWLRMPPMPFEYRGPAADELLHRDGSRRTATDAFGRD